MSYIIKDVITNTENGEVQVYYHGKDGYVNVYPEYCEPYSKKGCVINAIHKMIDYAFKTERLGEFISLENNLWRHEYTIVEVK